MVLSGSIWCYMVLSGFIMFYHSQSKYFGFPFVRHSTLAYSMFPHRTWSLSFYDMLALFGEFETHTPYDCTSTRQAKASMARLCDTWQDAIDDGQIPSKDHKDTITFFEFYYCCYPVQQRYSGAHIVCQGQHHDTSLQHVSICFNVCLKIRNTKIQLLIILFPLQNASLGCTVYSILRRTHTFQ